MSMVRLPMETVPALTFSATVELLLALMIVTAPETVSDDVFALSVSVAAALEVVPT